MPFWFLGLGNLNNGGNAGLFCVNSNNRLTRTRWNNGSRTSAFHVPSGTLVRLRRTYRRVFSNPNVARRACSYWGWLKHSDSWRFVRENGIRKAMRLARATVSAEDRRVYA